VRPLLLLLVLERERLRVCGPRVGLGLGMGVGVLKGLKTEGLLLVLGLGLEGHRVGSVAMA
jgi:hypothetical protein